MNQPAAIWSTRRIFFNKEFSNIQNIIFTQGLFALQSTIDRIDVLHQIMGPRTGNKMFINKHISPALHDLCSHAGIASTILFNNNVHSPRLEKKKAYEMRMERVAYVKRYCDEQNFTPSTLTDREIRNSLTHLDERLPEILGEKDKIGWYIDYAASERSSFTIPTGINEVKYYRSYVHNENKILHLDQEMDLSILREECVAVLAIVFGIDGNQK